MDEKQIKFLIESRHPSYGDRIAHWNFLESTYEGGREWFAGNIFRFMKEGDKEFAARVQRAYRFNHTKQVVDQVDKYVFKMPISRRTDDAPDALTRFWKRATLSGLDIDTFAKRISNATSIYGRVWVVIDSSVQPGEVTTVADEKQADGQVYAYVVRPQDFLDMSYDELGELNWALVREITRDDEDPTAQSRDIKERFRLWTRKNWYLFEVQHEKRNKVRYVQVNKGEHDLGMVPIVQADHVFSEEFYHAPGLIEDVAYLDRAVANYLSNLDAIIQDQTFSQLAMPAQGVLPGEDAHDTLMEMGTKRVFLYNGEAGAQPFYLAPDPKQAQLILNAISSIINEIYHCVGLSGERTESNSGGAEPASGVAKSYDFERVNSLLAAKARALQLTEQKIARVVCLYGGKKVGAAEALLQYPEEFDVRSVYDEFEIAAQLSLITAPDEVRREQMRALILKLFPAASAAVTKLLESSLKTWPPEAVAVAGLGAPQETQGAKSSGAKQLKAANTQRVAKELAT